MAVISGMNFNTNAGESSFTSLVTAALGTTFVPIPTEDGQNSLLTVADDVIEIGNLSGDGVTITEKTNGREIVVARDESFARGEYANEKSDEIYTLTSNGSGRFTGLSFKGSFKGSPFTGDTTFGKSENSTFSGSAVLDAPADLSSVALSSFSLKEDVSIVDVVKDSAGKPGYESSEKFQANFKGLINAGSNGLSGRIDSANVNYSANETARSEARLVEGPKSYKEISSVKLTGDNLNFNASDVGTTISGKISALSMSFDVKQVTSDDERLDSLVKYDLKGTTLNLNLDSARKATLQEQLIAALLAGDDQIVGTSGNDDIFGLAGVDTYTWDINKDGFDTVNLANLVSLDSPDGAVNAGEVIDTVVIRNDKSAIDVTLNIAKVGNGTANADEYLTIAKQSASANSKQVLVSQRGGAFDDEGMRFTLASGSLTINDRDTGFSTLLLGTENNDVLKSTTKRDFLVGGDGSDTFEIGKTGSKLVVNAKKMEVSGFDVIGDLTSGDELILSKTTMNGSSINANETTPSFESLFEALTAANAYFKQNKADLKAEGNAVAQKASHFFLAATGGDTYLFEDATNAGKTAQLVKLSGIVSFSDIQGALGLVTPDQAL